MKRIFAVVLMMMFAVSAEAWLNGDKTIGIDFGETAPTNTANFNAYTDVVIANGATESFAGTLIDTDGANVSGVGFNVQNNTGKLSYSGGGGSSGTGLIADNTIYGDGLISNDTAGAPLSVGGNFVFTFTGLNDSLTYDLTGGWDNNNSNFNSTWAADGQSVLANSGGGTGYISLTGLHTDGSGNLAITLTRTKHVIAAGLYITSSPPNATVIAIQ